jgi:hypothetical protein
MKNFMWTLKKDNKTTLKALSIKLGKEDKYLSKRLNRDSLKVADLKKCLECCGEKLVIVYRGESYEI